MRKCADGRNRSKVSQYEEAPMQKFTTLDHQDAFSAIEAIRDALTQQKKAAVIAITDHHGELLGLLRVGDVGLASINIAMNKAYTAARNRGATGDIGKAVRDPEHGFDINYFGDPRFIGWDGGLPVRVDGKVVGAVGVSGLTGDEDVALAQLGVDTILSAL
jgi:glc operon protein GlcG